MVRLRARGSGCLEQQENTADTQRRCWRQELHIGLALAAMLLFRAGSRPRALNHAQRQLPNEQAKQICAGSETDCPDGDIRAHAELTQGASNNFTRSYIAYGVGGALLTTGVVLLVTAPTTVVAAPV